jgi:hypothetical protein
MDKHSEIESQQVSVIKFKSPVDMHFIAFAEVARRL